MNKEELAIFLVVSLLGAVFSAPVFGQTSEQGQININALVPEAPAVGGPSLIISDFTAPTIYEIEVEEIGPHSVRISWKTDELAVPQLNYGETETYEKTYIGKIFTLENSILLEDLAGGKVYHLEIVALDKKGNRASSGDQTFKTLPPPDLQPPANISDLSATPGDGQIQLFWQLPPDLDFDKVKITRSTTFYPSSPDEGIVVYEGGETAFTDTALTNDLRYYYSAFAADRAGNYASGAVVSAVPQKPVPPAIPPEIPPELPPELPPAVPPELVPKEIEEITLDDFDFIWRGEKLPLIEKEKIRVEAEEPLTITIDYDRVPEVLKTMMVTLEKPVSPAAGEAAIISGEKKKTFSFLLRINQEKTAYLATLMPPEPGRYAMSFTILDYKNQTLKSIRGELEVEKAKSQPFQVLEGEDSKIWLSIIYTLIIVTGGAIIWLFSQRIRRQREIRDQRRYDF